MALSSLLFAISLLLHRRRTKSNFLIHPCLGTACRGGWPKTRVILTSCRYSVQALSKEGSIPAEALTAVVAQLVSQKAIDESASKKLPVSAYFDNRFVNELEKEGFFKKLWQ
jgi:hypothetical protein